MEPVPVKQISIIGKKYALFKLGKEPTLYAFRIDIDKTNKNLGSLSYAGIYREIEGRMMIDDEKEMPDEFEEIEDSEIDITPPKRKLGVKVVMDKPEPKPKPIDEEDTEFKPTKINGVRYMIATNEGDPTNTKYVFVAGNEDLFEDRVGPYLGVLENGKIIKRLPAKWLEESINLEHFKPDPGYERAPGPEATPPPKLTPELKAKMEAARLEAAAAKRPWPPVDESEKDVKEFLEREKWFKDLMRRSNLPGEEGDKARAELEALDLEDEDPEYKKYLKDNNITPISIILRRQALKAPTLLPLLKPKPGSYTAAEEEQMESFQPPANAPTLPEGLVEPPKPEVKGWMWELKWVMKGLRLTEDLLNKTTILDVPLGKPLRVANRVGVIEDDYANRYLAIHSKKIPHLVYVWGIDFSVDEPKINDFEGAFGGPNLKEGISYVDGKPIGVIPWKHIIRDGKGVK